MNRLPELSHSELKRLFDYEDGILIWRENREPHKCKGKIAGNFHKGTGYWKIKVGGRGYKRSRLVFAWHNDSWPTIVDHDDRNRTNDKIENLIASGYVANSINRTPSSNCQERGIHLDKRTGKFQVYFRETYGGQFPDIQSALAKRDAMQKEQGL